MTTPADRRETILEAALKLFHERGFVATTIDAVAEAAGVAKGSVYNYFRNKQDLYRQVFSASLAEDDARAEAVFGLPVSPTEKLERLFDLWFARLPHYKQIGGLLLEFWATAAHEDREGELKAILNDLYTRHRRLVVETLNEGISSGEFRRDVRPEDAASLIFAVTDGLTVREVLDTDFVITEDTVTAVKRATVLALTTAPDPPVDAPPLPRQRNESTENPR